MPTKYTPSDLAALNALSPEEIALMRSWHPRWRLPSTAHRHRERMAEAAEWVRKSSLAEQCPDGNPRRERCRRPNTRSCSPPS